MSASADQEKHPIIIPIPELKKMAAELAASMQSSPADPAVRGRFIELRAALFQRGVYDPVLGRFDSATVTQASASEIAEQLSAVAEAL